MVTVEPRPLARTIFPPWAKVPRVSKATVNPPPKFTEAIRMSRPKGEGSEVQAIIGEKLLNLWEPGEGRRIDRSGKKVKAGNDVPSPIPLFPNENLKGDKKGRPGSKRI